MRVSKKVSETSIRVLETLKILSKGSASIQDIIHHFEKINPNNRIYTNEVILKYINTLKVFGFKFIKEKDKYVLLNTPVQFEFDENDLKAICLVENLSKEFPEEKVKTEIAKFLQELEKMFSDSTKVRSHNFTRVDYKNKEFSNRKYLDQIKEYEKYCLGGQRLKITYTKNKAETSVMVEPCEIKYLNNEVYLSVYNPVSAQIQDINFNLIIKIEQLPLKSNFTNMYSSVTFLLKDRLAKAYELHESESLLQMKSDGKIVILNRKEDRVLLMKRLMRYGENCEVISPKSLREDMKQMVKSTLSNYN